MSDTHAPASLVGVDVLNLITTGMYHNPLAIYREYIQNAADAFGLSAAPNDDNVTITIDPAGRRISIRDNGPGLSHEDALRDLVPIFHSRKQRGTDRGFRGIGRLSGLAFAEAVTFYTRTSRRHPVTRVSWNSFPEYDRYHQTVQIDQLIQNCVDVSKLDGQGWPDHFFEVEIVNVVRHVAGMILNRETVRRYISEVCPVPMAPDFPFTSQIENLFDRSDRPISLQIVLSGDVKPVNRRHGSSLPLSKNRKDHFVGFEPFRVPAIDSDGDVAVGWLAHTSYLGALPKLLGIRGIRAREGNIQIGDERVFDALFPEERFNRWCVGEVHILDPRIVPNGRRDYFEPSPHTRNLENHLVTIFRGIATRCRKASRTRNQARKLRSRLYELEGAYDLAAAGYLKADNAQFLIDKTLQQVEDLRLSVAPTDSHAPEANARLIALHGKLVEFQPGSEITALERVRPSEIAAYQRVFNALTQMSPSPRIAKELIEGVLAYV